MHTYWGRECKYDPISVNSLTGYIFPQIQQQIQVKPAVTAVAGVTPANATETSSKQSRADFVPIASNNPVLSANTQSKNVNGWVDLFSELLLPLVGKYIIYIWRSRLHHIAAAINWPDGYKTFLKHRSQALWLIELSANIRLAQFTSVAECLRSLPCKPLTQAFSQKLKATSRSNVSKICFSG